MRRPTRVSRALSGVRIDVNWHVGCMSLRFKALTCASGGTMPLACTFEGASSTAAGASAGSREAASVVERLSGA